MTLLDDDGLATTAQCFTEPSAMVIQQQQSEGTSRMFTFLCSAALGLLAFFLAKVYKRAHDAFPSFAPLYADVSVLESLAEAQQKELAAMRGWRSLSITAHCILAKNCGWTVPCSQARSVMGSAINTVAFPAPQMSRRYYQDELQQRSDMKTLITSANESIPALFVRAQRSMNFLSAPPPTILYSHGNAEDLGLVMDYVDALAHFTGSDVLSYEYVGYSLSKQHGHTPSEAGCIRSIDAAWRYLTEQEKIHPRRIVIFGRSIGSGPSVDLASRSKVEGSEHSPLDVAGVILQSPLESGARAVLGSTVAWLGYSLDIFRNYEKIEKITAPVAIMHGTSDEVVPYANGQELLEQSDSEAERSSASGRRIWRVAVLLGGLALVAAAVWSVGRSKVRSGSRDLVDLGDRVGSCRTVSSSMGSGLWGFRAFGEVGVVALEEISCFESGMFYADPIKMDGTERTVEFTADACQQRCQVVEDCAHFTFWPDGGCLLTGDISYPKAAPAKYAATLSGPKFCGAGDDDDGEDDVVTPEADSSGSSGSSGLVTPGSSGLVAPEPAALPTLPPAAESKPAIAAVAGVNGTTCSLYPACVAAGIKDILEIGVTFLCRFANLPIGEEGDCCPNADQVSLGCCNGFPKQVEEVKIMEGTECSLFPACVAWAAAQASKAVASNRDSLRSRQSLALHQKLQNKYDPLWLEGYGHNNMPQDECFDYVKSFLRSVGEGKEKTVPTAQ
eukprot:s1164_g8.t1